MIQKRNLPEKLFGVNTDVLIIWAKPIGIIVLLLLSMIGIVWPKITEIQDKFSKVNSVRQKTSEVNQKRAYIQTVDQEELNNNATLLAAGLLPEKNAYLLIRVIKNVASDLGYGIDDFSVSLGDVKQDTSKNSGSKNYDKIPVTLTLIGPTDNYLALVKNLENSLPIMSIDDFEMQTASEVSSIKLLISAYFLREITNLKLENLSLSDLTPNQKELDLLSQIKNYQLRTVSQSGTGSTFTKYLRTDPFSTP